MAVYGKLSSYNYLVPCNILSTFCSINVPILSRSTLRQVFNFTCSTFEFCLRPLFTHYHSYPLRSLVSNWLDPFPSNTHHYSSPFYLSITRTSSSFVLILPMPALSSNIFCIQSFLNHIFLAHTFLTFYPYTHPIFPFIPCLCPCRLWAPKTGKCKHVFEGSTGHEGMVTCIAGSEDGDLIITGQTVFHSNT